MNTITKQLFELKFSIYAFADNTTVRPVHISKTNLLRKSYAVIATIDIIQVVQNAVAQGFKSQKKDDCIEKFIVVYGLSESKNDINHMRRLLDNNINSVVQVLCFSKAPYTSSCSSNQPGSWTACLSLKVGLASIKDKD